ncbi:MAG: choice-of-anchor I family protein [Fuerstiella sp.]
MIPRRRKGSAGHRRRSINRSPAVELLETRALLSGIELTAVGTYETGVFGESAAEIVAHDPATQRAFFTNADSNEVGILDVNDPTNPIQAGAIDLSPFGGGVNSLDVYDGIVAVAVENDVVTQPGSVVFFDTNGQQLGQVTVGALPDSLTFTPDGSKVLVANEGEPDGSGPAMATGEGGFQVQAIFTIGETFSGTTGALNPTTTGDYTPAGVLDGLGAYEHPTDNSLVRVFGNHELLNFRGYDYEVSDGAGGTFTLDGARISYFDIDKASREVVDSGIAYNVIYDANGSVATDAGFLANNFAGFSRFCSSVLVEQHQFGSGSGLEDTIYFAGEEDGGFFNSVGGAEWALDVATGNLWHVPAMGRGAWENITEIDTGTTTHVAFILADDSSPFDFDPAAADGNEAAPLYLYVGEKNPAGDFLEQNGLRDGSLYVWVSDTGELTPTDFNTAGTLSGSWVVLDNTPNLALADEFGANGFDEFGYPTQGNLWLQAKAAGAFGFSRPEDVATNPADGTEIVLASTGVDDFEVDPVTGNGVDTFGTIYTIKTDFSDFVNPSADITIIYDGDADLTRALRSPDNLDWADDGLIYVQEDKAEEDTVSGDEVLFGPGAANPKEAGIIQLNPQNGATRRVATIDRSVVLDPTTGGIPVDVDAGAAGEWETSGIIDVSTLFGEAPGSLFLFDIQAHGIEDQAGFNSDSRINDNDLVEGGQLAFLQKNSLASSDPVGSVSIIDLSGGVSAATVTTASFESFDGREDELRAQGVRIFSGRSVSQDVEPEYIAVSPDGLIARVTLQEANAFAVIDIATATVTDIQPLGLKDHSLPGNGLDASDRDGVINIASWPVFGMYMPDAVTSFEIGGQTFYATANEGDDRGEDERIKDLTLDPTAFPDAATLQLDENLGRLGVSTIDGDTDGDGDYDQLFSYGARSFTIWDTDGNVVFDSGDQFEQITAAAYPDNFNANNDENDPEGRSDNKGPEPEAITTGVINGRTFAFVGLERIGGIMVYDVTNPASAEFVSYVNNRDFSEDPETGNPGDLGVEDLKFVSAEDSPNGVPLVVAANEVSGTITIFQISGSIYNDGVLELIGTSDDDVVTINRQGFHRLQVKASFLDPRKEVYGASELDTVRVTTLEGNDRVIASRFVNVDIIAHLGSGNDIGIGGAGDDVFVGSDGNDLLKGGFGRNVLIGGTGQDRLHAGFFGNTMMIGGTTAFDDDSAALDLIMAEWTSDRSFDLRVRNLSRGTGPVLGGTSVKLDTRGPDRTVFDDGDRDLMHGRFFSLDWFFADVSGRDRDRIFGLTFFDRLDRI